MPSNEDLWRQLEDQERRDDARFQQTAGRRELKKRKPISQPRNDNRSPMQRYKEDIKPVLERRRRVEAGLPISNNPIYNLYLKVTGQDKLPEVDLVQPDEQFQVVGQTTDEIRKIISENPAAFKHLAKMPEKVEATGATRKTADDLVADSLIRGPIKIDEEEEE